MAQSKKFSTVKNFYNRGMWSKAMVKNAVAKEWITAAEYKEITGEVYEA